MNERPGFHLRPILTLALTLRLLLVCYQIHANGPKAFFGMATDLGSLSRNFALGLGLSSPFGGVTGPSAFLAPGYPIFIGTIFRLFGIDSRGSELVIMLFQTAFCIAAIALLMQMTRRFFGAKAANIAGLVWTFSPSILWLPLLFWETSLSILLFCGLLSLALVCADKSKSLARWVALGAVSGLTLLVNPSLLTVIVCCFAWAAWRARKHSLAGPIAGMLLCLLVFAPWPVRNLRVLHAFIPLRTNLGYELWQGNRPGANGFFNSRLHPSDDAQQHAEYSSLGELAYMRHKSELGKAAIQADPARFVSLTIKRFGSFWTGIDNKISALVVLHVAVTTLLGLVGLGLLLARRRMELATLLLPILLFFPAPYYLTHPDSRFRLVLDPILTMLAAYALTRRGSPLSELPPEAGAPHSSQARSR